MSYQKNPLGWTVNKMKYQISFVLYISVMSIGAYSQSNSSGITLIKKTLIGGAGGWDYISESPEDQRLYISHGNQVEVLNAGTHQKIGIISNTKGVHGISAIPALGKGYITNGSANNVTIFDKNLENRAINPRRR